MTDRASGYVTDIGYTYRYHAPLNPLRTRLAFLRLGLQPPTIRTACELGFGQGVSLAVHAAAASAAWWGNDLLPEHVTFARSLVTASGSGARLSEATFEAFDHEPGLPAFDFIGLHGVLSWISDENRQRVVTFIGRHLAPGGVVYTGCNALPGWSDMLPLRRVLDTYAARACTGSTVSRIEAALDFAHRLIETHPLHARANPGIDERFGRIRHADRRYLAHEYFNRDWRPLDFAEIADLLGRAGLRYAGSAHLPDHLDALNLSGEQQRLLDGLDDPLLRETVRDFVLNTQFRRDYWVREARPLSAAECQREWCTSRLVLTTPRRHVPDRVSGPLGEVRLDGPAHGELLDALADGGRPTLGEIHARGAPARQDLPALVEAAFALAAFEHVALAQSDEIIDATRVPASSLNDFLIRQHREGVDVDVLASPVTGGGIAVNRADMLFIESIRSGAPSSPDGVIESPTSRAAGSPVGSDTDDHQRRWRRFTAERLPVLRSLGIA